MVLAACSSINDLPVTDESYRDWDRHRAQLSTINSWEIHARSAIFVEQEVYQVGINWQREINQFVIVIEAPFGQGVFRIESGLQGDGMPPIKLSLPDGQVYFDDSAEALLKEVLGWSIPVSGLKSWIKGLPLINTDYSFDLRADGRLKSLRQDDWVINYLEYFSSDNTAQGLPRKMYLKHQDLALKIVIDRWQQTQARVNSPVLFPDFD
jgi:outer membrane lipoprotein LolB